jgi:hypothetical protein
MCFDIVGQGAEAISQHSYLTLITSGRNPKYWKAVLSLSSVCEVFLHRLPRAAGSKDIGKDTVDLSVHDQADMPARHFLVFSLETQAGPPVHDLIPFGENCGKSDTFRERREDGLRKPASTPQAAAVRRRLTSHPPKGLQQAKG